MTRTRSMTRDQLIAALKDVGMGHDPVLIDTPTTLNAGAIEEVRPARDDDGHFLVIQVSADA